MKVYLAFQRDESAHFILCISNNYLIVEEVEMCTLVTISIKSYLANVNSTFTLYAHNHQHLQ